MTLDPRERASRLDSFAAGPGRLEDALGHIPGEHLDWQPAVGEWSARQVLCHCADIEAVYYVRFRFLAAEKAPTIHGLDQDRWAAALDYARQPHASALAVVKALRAHTLPVLRRLPADAWTRPGHHTEYGAFTGDDCLRMASASETHCMPRTQSAASGARIAPKNACS